MFPYFTFYTISFGPVQIQVWGLFVALGIFTAVYLISKRLKKNNLLADVAWDLGLWIILASFLSARFFHVIFYEPFYFLEHPNEIFALWQGGLSVIGGFFGSFLASLFYFWKKKISLWHYAPHFVFYLPLGLAIGRIGCAAVHEHPGIMCAKNCFLALDGPNGPQYDLGFLLSISNFLLFSLFLVFDHQPRSKEFYPMIFFLWYGVTRFSFDFLRAWDGAIVDARYFFLTPAQYASLLFLVFGIYFWKKSRRTNAAKI